MSKTKVVVIFGGASSEHDISLVSATNVIENMPKDKYEVICIGITKKGRWLYYPETSAILLQENGKRIRTVLQPLFLPILFTKVLSLLKTVKLQ